MSTPSIQRIILTVGSGFILLHLALAWQLRHGIQQGLPDFSIFYTAGTIVDRGLTSHLYDADLQYSAQREFVPTAGRGRGLLPFNHPPFEALVFAPLSHLPYLAAYVTWGVLNLVFLIIACRIVQPFLPHLSRFHPLIALPVALAFYPSAICLLQGQDSILVLLLYCLGFADFTRGRFYRSGLWFGFSVLKAQLIVPLIAILLLSRYWTLCWGFLTSAAAMAVLSLSMVGWHTALHYPTFLFQLENGGGAGAVIDVNMPNLHGLVSLMLPTLKTLTPVILVVLSIAFVIAAANVMRKHNKLPSRDLAFALSVAVTVLVSYHGFVHDWTLLLLPVFLCLDYIASLRAIATWPQRLLVVAVGGIFFSPFYLIIERTNGKLSVIAPVLIFWVFAMMALLQTWRIRPGMECIPLASRRTRSSE